MPKAGIVRPDDDFLIILYDGEIAPTSPVKTYFPVIEHKSILISDNKQIKVILIENTCLLKQTVFDTQPDLFLHKPNLI